MIEERAKRDRAWHAGQSQPAHQSAAAQRPGVAHCIVVYGIVVHPASQYHPLPTA
jgi:hypothetical protein